MVSLNFFKLFKRKKAPKNTPIDSKTNDTKLNEDTATNVSKVDTVSKKGKLANLQEEKSNGWEQIKLKEKEEDSIKLHEQLSGNLNKEHEGVNVIEPVDVEQQGQSNVAENKSITNEINVPEGTSVTEEIKEAESTPVFEENEKAPVIIDEAKQSKSISKEAKKPEIIPVVIDGANAAEDAEIIDQEVSNENLLYKGETTQQFEIPAEINEDKAETDGSLGPIEPTKSVEIPGGTNEEKVETDESLGLVEPTKSVEIPAETNEDKVEADGSLGLVEPTDASFKEFLKNAENNVFPNEQSKEIFKSYNDGEIDEAAAIILLEEVEDKAKPKTNSNNIKKSKKNNNKKKGKKGKKK